MPRKQKQPHERPLKMPDLSAVEFTALVVYLDYERSKLEREIMRWEEQEAIGSNDFITGQLKHLRHSLTVVVSLRSQACQAYDLRRKHGKLPRPVLTAGGVLDRNQLVGQSD